ncbi:MAG TPA: protein-L-isoaspartate(D-aspartate) O-methyltransferase [Acidobacteriota bacterium]|nr:protein-L-isoaspartate(D-aspartate) O-methyltransferase [Acidobacteriota bacterium]
MTKCRHGAAWLALVAVLAVVPQGCTNASDADSAYAKARKAMIDRQIASRGITDERLLAAFDRVERHRFVDKSLAPLAYADHPLPIGQGQTISQPYIVALMTQLLDLKETDTVLEVGTGSGYQAAILAELCAHVFTIEIVESLGRSARTRLDDLGYTNVTVRIGDGYRGWPENAPFDAVVVTCAPPEIPQPLLDQLAEGGRLVIPVGTNWQELILIVKKDGKLTRKSVTAVRFVPMTGESQEKK